MKNNRSSDKLKLYNIFYDFCLRNTENADNAKKFAENMMAIFSQNKHKILTISKNLNDGIGDYVSQLYFIKKLNDIFSQIDSVELKNISLVSETKNNLAKIVREDIIQEDSVAILDNHTINVNDKQNIVGIPSDKNKFLLDQIINEADFLFNIALELTATKGLLKYTTYSFDPYPDMALPTKNDGFISSWTQYNFLIRDQSFSSHFSNIDNYIEINANSPYVCPVFSQLPMGFHEGQMGIRFSNSISDAVAIQREELSSSLSTKVKNMLHLDDTPITKQSLTIGYLQKKSASQDFALLAVANTMSDLGDLNIITNTSHFEQKDHIFSENVFSDFTTIEVVSNNVVSKWKDDPTSENKRTLRLIDLRDINNSDKTILYGLANNMIGGSGDTSLSEMITSGLNDYSTPIPFPQNYLTGGECIASLIKEIHAFEKVDESSHEELCLYLENLKSNNCKSNINIIKNNKETILHSWNKFCHFLFINRNEEIHFNELLVTYSFHSLIKNNKLDELITLAKLLKKDALPIESLLHLAVKLKNLEAVKLIIENDLCDINKYHPFNGYNALQLAIFFQNKDMIDLLLNDQNIDLAATDNQNNLTIQIAIKTNNTDIIKLLLIKLNIVLSTLKDTTEKYSQEYLNGLLNAAIESAAYCVNSQNKIPSDLLQIYRELMQNIKSILQPLSKDETKREFFNKTLKSLVQLAAAKNVAPLLNALLQHEINFNSKDYDSLLLNAIERDMVTTVDYLLSKGVSANSGPYDQFFSNTSPLHLAVKKGNPQIVKKLLQFGANINAVDSQGLPARDYCTNEEVSKILKTALTTIANKSNLK